MTPEEFIRHWGVRSFFHFTDESNLQSIRENGGLHSLAELERRGIKVVSPGGNEWSHEADAIFGLDRYVHLWLIDDHPMEFRARQEGRIKRPRYLQIDPRVLGVEGVLLTAGVANKSDVELLTLAEAVEVMDLEVVYRRTNWRDSAIKERRKVAKKYEVLVPTSIPVYFIRGL